MHCMILSTIYNMSGRVVSDLQTRAEDESYMNEATCTQML